MYKEVLPMEDVFVYLADLPDGINELVSPCADGFTVWIDQNLDDFHRKEAYMHALKHIERDDFSHRSGADRIERDVRREKE